MKRDIRPKKITWSTYREARRWIWKMRKYGFIAQRTVAAHEMREMFNRWWMSPVGQSIKNSDGEFKAIRDEAERRARARRAIKTRARTR
jgi:hypothetical protein